MITRPTREQAIQMARDLIEGRKTPTEVSDWAVQYYSDNQLIEALENDDPILEEFISTLGMADLIYDTAGSLLYGKDDYRSWLEDFLSEIAT